MGRLMSDELTTVYDAPDELLSQAVKDVLDQNGIPVVEQLDTLADVYLSKSAGQFFGRYSKLLVPQDRAELARRIVADFLAAYESGALSLPEDFSGREGEDQE